MGKTTCAVVLIGMAITTSRVAADVWDRDDNTYSGTHNELIHGSDQLHDLDYGPSTDHDWYRLSQKPYSSYEVVVDTTSSAIGPPLTFDLVGSNGSSVVESSLGVSSLGYSRSLRFYNDTASAIDNQYIHVTSGACTTTCTANDTYRIRFFDTTLALVKFNNTEPQYQYIFLQNPTDYSMDVRVYFWDEDDTLLCKTNLLTLGPKLMATIDDDEIIMGACSQGSTCDAVCDDDSNLEDLDGHATVLNTGRYGDLGAKGSTLNAFFPTDAHFEFDTDMPPRPY